MTTDQLNQLTNILASITLFEMMVATGLGVTFSDVLRVAIDWWLVSKAALASYICVPARRSACWSFSMPTRMWQPGFSSAPSVRERHTALLSPQWRKEPSASRWV